MVRDNKSHRDVSTVLRADYALFHKSNLPLAVVEAKDNNQSVGTGMQQALNYAAFPDVPFMFSSHGDGLPPCKATKCCACNHSKRRAARKNSSKALLAARSIWQQCRRCNVGCAHLRKAIPHELAKNILKKIISPFLFNLLCNQ